jgi:hypothetical protein
MRVFTGSLTISRFKHVELRNGTDLVFNNNDRGNRKALTQNMPGRWLFIHGKTIKNGGIIHGLRKSPDPD